MSQRDSASRRGGLGRGLAALIPTGPPDTAANTTPMGNAAADVVIGGQRKSDGSAAGPDSTPAADVTAPETTGSKTSDQSRTDPERVGDTVGDVGATYRELAPTLIQPNPQQPRTVFDDDAMNELVHSIREFGLMQPIVVRTLPQPTADGVKYQLVMGERRWRASQIAGLETIPAIVRETSDGDMLRDALLENIHRAQLNPLEEAAAYQQLLDEFGVTHEELATRLGRSRPLISNMIRLLKLPIPVQRRVAAGVLSAGHARALLSLETGSGAQEALAARIVAEGLSVRATEEAVTLANRGDGDDRSTPAAPKRRPMHMPGLQDVAERLSNRLDTRVTVSLGKRKGKIVVEYGSVEDLQRIVAVLDPEGRS